MARRARLVAALCACACVLAACGSGKNDTATKTPEPQQPTLSAAAGVFKNLGIKGGGAKAKVTYTLDNGDGAARELIVAQDPPKRSYRVTTATGEDDVFLIATETNDFIACRDGSCIRLPGLGTLAGAAGESFLGPLAGGFDYFNSVTTVPGFLPRGGRTIAGRAASCAAYAPPFAPAGLEQCLDKESGLSLFMKFTSGGKTTTVQAVAVTEPAVADFTPPHPVSDLPTGFASDDPSPSPSDPSPSP